MKKPASVRVVDGGGNGFRRSDVRDGIISNLVESGPFTSPEEIVRFATADLPSDSCGVSYAVAGIVQDEDVVVSSPNIKFFDFTQLGTITTRVTGKLTVVSNDMVSAVAGMAVLVPEVKGKPFIGITVSSGIGIRFADEKGRSIFLDIEGGHVQIDPSPYATLCGCGKRGCVEAIAGGEAVRRRVLAETEALGIKIPPGMHPCAFLDQSFKEGESWAVDIYTMVANALGDFLVVIQHLTHVPIVVWKGTFAQKVIPSITSAIRLRIRSKIMDPRWSDEMAFYYSPDVGGVKNADSFIGAASILLRRFKEE